MEYDNTTSSNNSGNPKKIAPNLSSPKLSTGPTTPSGKATSSQNARKHGIFSSVLQLTAESRGEYNYLLDGLFKYFEPKGTLEEILVEKLAVLTWRYRRLIATETAEMKTGEPLEFAHRDSDTLSRFPRYETSIDRAFDRTLTQLERYQRMRKGQNIPPPISVDISS